MDKEYNGITWIRLTCYYLIINVWVNTIIWLGWLSTQASTFGMVGKTSKACLADSGMVSLVTCYLIWLKGGTSHPLTWLPYGP